MTRLVQERRNRESGTVVLIWDNRDGSFDESDSNDWFTQCEEHSFTCSHPTLQLAREWATEPSMWCDGCQAIVDGAG